MRHTLTEDEIKALVECERMMDDGRVAFVMLQGQRVSVSSEAMAEFGFKKGQTINDTIFCALLQFNIANIQTKIALNKAQAAARAV